MVMINGMNQNLISKYKNSIVINEIMADPVPSAGLPEYEYIELYNLTDSSINITGWCVIIGKSVFLFPKLLFNPRSYLIICTKNAEKEYNIQSQVLGILSANVLTNSGQTIVIKDNNNLTVDSVSYNLKWYHDSNKSEGGYSIERIDPENFCSTIQNWTASVNSSGGTPGYTNSCFSINTDTIKPYISQLYFLSDSSLLLEFSEYINHISLIETSNYYAYSQIGSPAKISRDQNDNIILFFEKKFNKNSKYTLSLKNITDDCGNELLTNSYDIYYYIPQIFDIIINELMLDPDPPIHLPAFEYIELFNRTAFTLNAINWKIIINNKIYDLPNFNLEAYNFLILTSDKGYNDYKNYSKTLILKDFQGLNNSQGNIIIKDNNNKIISFVDYSDEWYNDEFKKNGGWSLEKIDPDNFCTGKTNWTVSENFTGGTPGKKNSVYNSNKDLFPPEILNSYLQNDSILFIKFNEPVIPTDLNSFSLIFDDYNTIESVEIIEPSFSQIKVQFQNNFKKGRIYNFIIKSCIFDCNLNNSSNLASKFAIPDSATFNDFIINEILFEPFVGCPEFVELYNKSKKVINLNNYYFVTSSISESSQNYSAILSEPTLLYPDEYFILSKDISKLSKFYIIPTTISNFNYINMPNIYADNGIITIYDKYKNIIDRVSYNKGMHLEIIKNTRGVSLERINPAWPSEDINNWHSAAETAGFATPGYKNSQFIDEQNSDKSIHIEPYIFSPDNDGYDDKLVIYYKFNSPGYIIDINIFDLSGKFVKSLANNDLASTEGYYVWNGTTENKYIAATGTYIIIIQYYNLKGEAKKILKPCYLAVKL
jgi:hypothetical protein